MRAGLTARTALASTLLAVVIVGVFGSLLYEIRDLEQNRATSRKARAVFDASQALDADVGDLTATSRGYLLTKKKEFLTKLLSDQTDYAADAKDLEKTLAAFSPKDLPSAQNLVNHLDQYSASLRMLYSTNVDIGKARETFTGTVAREKLNRARSELQEISERMEKITTAKRTAVNNNTNDALLIALIGVILSLAMIVLYSVFLRRYVVKPVEATSEAAKTIASGDLTTRLPNSGAGEIKTLNLAFNQMAQSLQSSRDELRTLEQERERFWSTSLELLAVCDFDGIFTRLNPIWEETLGFTIDELCSKPCFEFVHPDDLESTMQAASQLFDGGVDVVGFENRYLCADGSYRWLQWTSTVDMDLELSFGVARDITARKNTERIQKAHLAASRALAVSSTRDEAIEKLLSSLGDELGASNAIYWETGPKTAELIKTTTWLNPEVESSAVEVLSELATLNFSAGPIAGAWPGGTPVLVEDISQAHPTVKLTEIASSAFVLPIVTEKRPYGIFEFFFLERGSLDRELITQLSTTAALIEQFFDRKTAEEEAEKLKDEFFALVSHELRTPLTSIIGYLELIAEDKSLSDETRDFLNVIQRNANRLMRLVGDILFAAQFEAGTLNLDVNETDLIQLASNAINVAKPRADGAEIQLNLLHPGLETLAYRGDSDRIGQLLDNLISNAVKFTPPKGEITVTIARQNGHAKLTVSDTGMGIPPEEQDHLFERFFRSNNAVREAVPGVGLGLTISRGITEAHGGSISVDSETGESHGTTFTVELPLGGPNN